MTGETIAIIPCTSQKSMVAGPAREVWQGAHFQLVLAHAEMFYDTIYVMSYKYGLIDPDFEIEPYDINIKYASAGDKLKWWFKLREQIQEVAADEPLLVALYTGNFERQRIMREWARAGVRQVILPFEHSTIGQRMQNVYDGIPPFDLDKAKRGEYTLPEGFGEPKKRGRPTNKTPEVNPDLPTAAEAEFE